GSRTSSSSPTTAPRSSPRSRRTCSSSSDRRARSTAQDPGPTADAWAMNGGRPVRAVLALLIGWTVLREAEVGPLRSIMHGPLFAKGAYWTVVVGASLLTLWRGVAVCGGAGAPGGRTAPA